MKYWNRIRTFALLLVAISLVGLTGCADAGDEFSSAEITSLTLSRTTFTVAETGMTDEFIDAEVGFTGFLDPVDPDQSEIFLQELDRAAVPQSAMVTGNTLVLEDIATSWLGGLDAGEYQVGATLVTASESLTKINLATVTITEN